MKSYFILSALACLGIFLQAGSANDQYNCDFKYKIGNNDWVQDSASGTTRSLDKVSVAAFLENKESQANSSGQDFESAQLFCNDILKD